TTVFRPQFESQLCQGGRSLRPQGRDGKNTGRTDRSAAPVLRSAKEGSDHLHRGHPQSGAGRTVPPRRHEKAHGRGGHPARGHACARGCLTGSEMTVAVKPTADPKALAVVDELVRRARAAMAVFAGAGQARVDEALKGRNAIVIAASPAGLKTTQRTVDYMRAELKKVGLPEDLVQIVPPPASKDMTQALMEAADLVVATGSQDNVRRAYSSGTPAI